MKIVARILVFVLIILQFSGIIENISYATEITELEVSNGFVKYTVNSGNGRFSISTESGAAYRNDENQPLLFEEYFPDTSFTTFKIDGEDYIYGNNYGFLNILETNGYFDNEPTNSGLENSSTWVINGIRITQTLTLDNTDENAGNVKVSYHVKNESGHTVDIGSRILLDTMLGANDASPVIFPDDQSVIEKEAKFTGEAIPIYWRSIDNKDFANVVSYGLISGWRGSLGNQDIDNTKPDEMIIGHWEGLSKTKWDYAYDSNLDFTSADNAYGSRDSAVALYWNEKVLMPDEERIYELYYGLGENNTVENEVPVGLNTYSPERLYLNDSKTGYTKDTVKISGEVINNLNGSQPLINAKVTLDSYTPGLTLPYGESKTINLGTINPNPNTNTTTPFSWDLETSKLYNWTNFQYRVSLTADNLTQAITRDGNILIPSVTGEPPEIKFTEYFPGNLYFIDDQKVLTITGQNLDAIQNSRVIIRSEIERPNCTNEFIVGEENLEFSNTSITVNIPYELLFFRVDHYNVTIEYLEDGEIKSYTFDSKLNLSSDKKYMIRKYGILMVVRVKDKENGEYSYELVNAKDESELETLEDNESIILDLRADEIMKIGNIYTINSETVTINSVVTCRYNQDYGDDPMTIEKKINDITHNGDYVFITGKGRLEIPGFQFHNGPYEMELEDGTFYSVTDEDDADDVVIHKPLLYKGWPVVDYRVIMQALPININEAVLRENAITFGGSIDLAALLNGAQKISEEKKDDKDNNNNDDDEEEEENDADFGASLNIDDLRFGVNNGYVTLEGLRADGSVGIPKEITKKIVPECDLGAEIGVEIDTFDNWKFGIHADINFEVIQAKGDIVFKIFEIEGIPIPIPDTVIIYGGNSQPGIPLIPPVPVGFLTGLGGGFEGLYDTLTLNFNFLPPLTLNAIASFQLFKILEANEATLKVSARGISFNVDSIGIGPLDIFENVGMHVFVKDDLQYPGFEIKTYAGLSLAGWVTADAYYLCAVDAAKHGNLGPVTIIGEASGSVHIPDDSPILPGTEFASANLGISDEGVFAKLVALGFLPVGFSYYWGGDIVLGFASLEDQEFKQRGMYSVANYDEEGNQIGSICIGENFHVISDSRSEIRFASISNVLPFYIAGLDNHKLNIINHDYSLIEVEYYGDEPELQLFKPLDQNLNREEVPLVKDENYLKSEVATVNGANKIYIALESPENGEWELTSSKAVNTRLIMVDEIPELKQVSGNLNGSQLDVNWSSDDELSNKKVNIVLCEDIDNDPGKMIARDLVADNGNANIELPVDLPSGDYYIKAQLINDEGAVLSTVVSKDTISYNNPNQPDDIRNMSVNNVGNGLLNVKWDDPQSGADGYVIDVIDNETDERISSFDLAENAGDNIIGGTYKQISSLTNDNNADEINNSGMIPGKTYKISVSSYNDVNEIKHYSEEVTMLITIDVPNPANINYDVSCITGDIIDKGIKEEIQTYLTKEQNVNLSLGSDQGVKWKVIVNDEVIYNQTDSYTDTDKELIIDLTEKENHIGIKAINDRGDISEESLMIELDQEPPILRIDYPRQGELVKDYIVISGFVDLNSTLKINGVTANYDDNGLFKKQIPMGDNMTQTIRVEAIDEAKNKSEYLAEVYNDKIKDIKNIKINPNTNQIIVGDEEDYDVYLVDEDGNEFIMDDSLISWSLLNDYGVMDVNDNGNVKALTKGSDVLIASYKTSKICYEENGETKQKDYSFQDAVVIEVVEENRVTDKIIVNPDAIYMSVNDYHTLDVYEVFVGGSNRLLNNEMVKFSIVSGDEFIDLSDMGDIHAKAIGDENESENAIVSVSYVKNGEVYQTNVMINITKNNNNSSHRLSTDDQFIIDILKKIANPDGSATFAIKKSEIKKVNGKAKVTLTVEGIKRAFSKANVNKEGKKKIILQIPEIERSDGYVIDIPRKVLHSNKGNIIELETGLGTITLPCDMLGNQLAGNSKISIVIERANREIIEDETKDKIGDRPIIDISLMGNGNASNWKNENSPVRVYIGYTVKDGEDYEKIIVLYIDEDGNPTKVKNGKYDLETGMVVFETNHLSKYAIAYEEKNFSDLENHLWAKHQIEVLASKGIINGTSKESYSPGRNITRADFLTLLVRTLELRVDIDSNFSDIKETDYFYEAVGIAKKLGITNGSGNNMFKPGDSITRQDMMVLTERALRIKGKIIGECDIAELDKFNDRNKIASYAENSVATLVNKELIKGSGGRINPRGNTTRAEIAVLLYRIYND